MPADLATLETLLEQEAAALRQADFAALEGLATRKEALLARGLNPAATAPDLRRLQQLTRRNAALLDAARRGLEAAMHGIEAARHAGTLVTYDGTGQRQHLAGAARRTDGRA